MSVRLLLDESLLRQLAGRLSGHEVRTVVQQGWAGLSNGEILCRAVQAGFDALLTGDQNLQYQQDIPATGLGVVVLVARANRIQDLIPLVPKVFDALEAIRPGEVIEVRGA